MHAVIKGGSVIVSFLFTATAKKATKHKKLNTPRGSKKEPIYYLLCASFLLLDRNW